MNFIFVIILCLLKIYNYFYLTYVLTHILIFLLFFSTLIYDIYILCFEYNILYFIIIRIYFIYFLFIFWGIVFYILVTPLFNFIFFLYNSTLLKFFNIIIFLIFKSARIEFAFIAVCVRLREYPWGFSVHIPRICSKMQGVSIFFLQLTRGVFYLLSLLSRWYQRLLYWSDLPTFSINKWFSQIFFKKIYLYNKS